MKPFPAWLAMSVIGGPFVSDGWYRVCRTRDAASIMPEVEPERVLIIEDTEDNRRKLGMEEEHERGNSNSRNSPDG